MNNIEVINLTNEENIEFLKLKNGLIDTEKATNILKENKIHLTENIFENDAIIMKKQLKLKNLMI